MKDFFKILLAAGIVILLPGGPRVFRGGTLERPPSAREDILKPNPAQLAWQEAELGILFSYDLHVFDGERYNQARNRVTPVPDHNIFHPESLDTDQWLAAAKDMGARFALLTATHETGFALYPSDVNPYSLKAVKWRDGKGDIVGDFVASCRKFGIAPGIYIGIRWNSFYGVHDFEVRGEGAFRENRQAHYRRMAEGMVEELCTRYGPLFEIWFDGGADHPGRGAPDVLPIVKKHQPGALFYHNAQLAEARWGGSESGTVSYPCWATFPYPSTDAKAYPKIIENGFALLKTGDPGGRYWMPAMSDAPLRGFNGRHEWFWEPGGESHIFPLPSLMGMYYRSVGRNSTLILGITPDPRGLVPEPDRARMKEFGDEVRGIFGKPVASVSGEGDTVGLTFDVPTSVDHVVIQEDIRHGERVRKYVLEGDVQGTPKTLEQGTCIGHKRIVRFESLRLDGIRLRILESVASPMIKTLAAYDSRDKTSYGTSCLVDFPIRLLSFAQRIRRGFPTMSSVSKNPNSGSLLSKLLSLLSPITNSFPGGTSMASTSEALCGELNPDGLSPE